MENIDKSKNKGITRWLPIILPVALIAILLPVAIAIAMSDDGGDNESSTPEETQVAATPQAGAIEVSNFAFDPNEITVRMGDSLTFQNTSQTEHKIHIGDLGEAASAGGDEGYLLSGGETWEWTSEEVGTFDLTCSIHPNQMTGEVTVTEAEGT